ncbi:MAG: hypothetical protein HKM93_20325 [Desulfobacteraceae bacterium]|nr:hypothetical protein [Desulfobacteraceae bacterium]
MANKENSTDAKSRAADLRRYVCRKSGILYDKIINQAGIFHNRLIAVLANALVISGAQQKQVQSRCVMT